MNEQPEALRIAEWFEGGYGGCEYEAAAELRRLHALNQELLRLVKRYRAETPLGHQPHMIAHEADAAIAKAGETK